MASDSYYLTAPTVRTKREILLPHVAPEYLDALCAAVAEVAEAKKEREWQARADKWLEREKDFRQVDAFRIKKMGEFRAENAALRKALESIASNTCCDGCREAARDALRAEVAALRKDAERLDFIDRSGFFYHTLDAFAALTPCGYGVVDSDGVLCVRKDFDEGNALRDSGEADFDQPQSAPHRVVRLYAAREETT